MNDTQYFSSFPFDNAQGIIAYASVQTLSIGTEIMGLIDTIRSMAKAEFFAFSLAVSPAGVSSKKKRRVLIKLPAVFFNIEN